jgi:hypothetical protein
VLLERAWFVHSLALVKRESVVAILSSSPDLDKLKSEWKAAGAELGRRQSHEAYHLWQERDRVYRRVQYWPLGLKPREAARSGGLFKVLAGLEETKYAVMPRRLMGLVELCLTEGNALTHFSPFRIGSPSRGLHQTIPEMLVFALLSSIPLTLFSTEIWRCDLVANYILRHPVDRQRMGVRTLGGLVARLTTGPEVSRNLGDAISNS